MSHKLKNIFVYRFL